MAKKAKLSESEEDEDQDIPFLPVSGGFDWDEQRTSVATAELEEHHLSDEDEAGKVSYCRV